MAKNTLDYKRSADNRYYVLFLVDLEYWMLDSVSHISSFKLLNLAMGIVLVNGSPTLEFQFHKGLKQGDPLSPFLFILIMESLHLSFSKVTNAGLFSGIPIDISLTFSHLFFADDAIFIVLPGVLKLLESIRRNFFNRLDGSKRKMDWISWNKILASKKYGGLGVSTIYGEYSALNSSSSLSKRSPWLDINREVTVLRTKGINLLDLIHKKVWSLEATGEFFVKSVRQFIDDSILPKEEVATRRVKFMPIKINVFAWRVCLDKLSARLNLSFKGIDISTIICPL
ncbi:hypothetical protein Tco_1265006 [Tanacetum coccineum]